MELCQRRIAHGERRIELPAAERAAQYVFDATERIVIETLARQVHQARPEAPHLIAAQDQAHTAWTVVQRQYRARAARELGDRGLKQLVARQIVEDADQPFAVVAGRPERERADHARHLETHERHRARVGVVGVRGPQAQELRLAGQAAAPIKFLDDDVVQVSGTMHGRAPIGLCDHQQLALGPQRHQIARRMSAHDAHRRAWNRLEMRFASPLAQAAAPETEEGKMVVFHVGQQRGALGDHRGRQRRRLPHQLFAHGQCRLPHGLPALAGVAHV